MGSPIRNAYNILALLDAVLLPKEVLLIHCRGHHKGEDKIAKWAAMQEYIGGPLLWEGILLPPEIPQYRGK
jgi:hypothetical protein